jgi:hypothetical protein
MCTSRSIQSEKYEETLRAFTITKKNKRRLKEE